MIKRTILFIMLSVAAFGTEYKSIVITQGEWVDNVGNHFYFDLSQVEFVFEYQLPEEPGEHVCEFPDNECVCIYAGVEVSADDVPDELKPPDPAKFLDIENWIDTSQLRKNRRGNYIVEWVSQDGTKSGEITLNTIESTPAWKDQVVEKYLDIKTKVDAYAKKWIDQYTCPYDNPRHQDINVVKGTLEDGCVYCNWCRKWLSHKQESNSCKCLCGWRTSHTKNPLTCRCFCTWEHYPVLTSCPGVCAVCGNALDGVKSDPNKHTARTDGQCGCKCGYFGANNPANNEEFHVASETSGETCMCKCGHWHDYTSSDCEDVCGTCKHRKRSHTPTEATEDDHTPNAASAHRCGCKCGKYTADGTDNPRFHIQMANSCRCYGSDGNGGKFHFPCARSDCTKICQYEESGVPHLANLGTVAEKIDAVTPATPADHTPDTGATHCGCKCGEYDNNSSAQDLAGMHNHKDGTCACWCTKYAATAGDDDLWHNWQTGACLCDCTLKHKFTGGGACSGICAVCKARNSSSEIAADCLAAPGDHTAKNNACGCACGAVTAASTVDPKFHNGTGVPACRCNCGKLHKYYNGSTAGCRVCSVCQLTEDDREPSDETLHKANPSKDCECYCGYFSPENHQSTSEALHTWDSSDVDANGVANCMCECGTLHKFRESTYLANQDKQCNGVCVYCKERLRNGALAQEDDHDPKPSSAQRCGCKCGKLDSTATADKFHIQKPGTCKCYGADGNGGSHHFKHPKSGCTRICAYSTAGDEHLTAGRDHEIGTVPAGPEDHTRTDTIGYCGCKCREYTGAESSCPATFHNQNPNYCGCYCTHSSKDGHHRRASNSCWCYCDEQMLGHIFPDGECRCYCYNTAHHSSHKHTRIQRQDGKCPGVCHGPCGEASNPTYRGNHSPKSDGCGCQCGEFAGSAYQDQSFHNGHGSPYCLCACGAYHNQSVQRADCTQICRYCGDGRTNYAFMDPITEAPSSAHQFPADSCTCKCGKKTDHRFADDSCECFCGLRHRAHVWVYDSEAVQQTYVCQSCGNTITQYQVIYECSRCGEALEGMREEGHASGCGMPEYPPTLDPCGCSCTDCSCSSCLNGSGVCTTCGNPCGEESAGGGGNAGSTAGPGSLDDI